MELFEVELIKLMAGDQFETDAGYGWKYYEVYSNNAGSVRIFPTDVPLLRDDGTPIRNMIYTYRHTSPGLKVKPIINKRPVLNRNHEEYGDSKTWLFPKRQQETILKQ